IISHEELENAYQGDPADHEWTRHVAASHFSEWSDFPDWLAALKGAPELAKKGKAGEREAETLYHEQIEAGARAPVRRGEQARPRLPVAGLDLSPDQLHEVPERAHGDQGHRRPEEGHGGRRAGRVEEAERRVRRQGREVVLRGCGAEAGGPEAQPRAAGHDRRLRGLVMTDPA